MTNLQCCHSKLDIMHGAFMLVCVCVVFSTFIQVLKGQESFTWGPSGNMLKFYHYNMTFNGILYRNYEWRSPWKSGLLNQPIKSTREKRVCS